jgi:hypothetical protein
MLIKLQKITESIVLENVILNVVGLTGIVFSVIIFSQFAKVTLLQERGNSAARLAIKHIDKNNGSLLIEKKVNGNVPNIE